jgi:peptidoglycan/LPS O-acetylase OafA/YrhL
MPELDTTLERPGQPPTMRKFRPDIEGLRAVAVLAVVVGHAGLAGHGGYVGVDVFFVISGFLITRQLVAELERRDRISFAGFYARRARRILPAATVVSVATLLASLHWLSPLRMYGIGRDAIYAAFSGINLRLAQEGTDYFKSGAPPSPFQHYWSLSVEEQFYLLWPLLLVVGGLAGPRRSRTKRLAWTLLGVMAVSLWLSVTVTHDSQPWAYFGGHTRAWELALGAFLAVVAGRLRHMPNALAAQLSWLGLAAIVFACLRFDEATSYPGLAVALPVLGAAAMVAAGCAAPRCGAELVLGRAPMQFAGRVSYSWYLWHWPILIIWPEATERALTTPEKAAGIGLSLALAVATFHLVEQPFRRRHLVTASPLRGLGAGAGLVAAAVAAALLVTTVVKVPTGGTVAKPVFGTATAASAPGAGSAHGQVVAAVRAATRLTALPANLTPSLTDAAKDLPQTHACSAERTQSAPTYPCGSFGDPRGRRTIAVVGDSHAGMWVPAFDAVARRQHWKMLLFEKDGCPIANYPDFVSSKLGRVFTECNAWRAAVIRLVGTLRPSLVAVAGQTRSVALGPEGMEETIGALAASGAKVVFLEDTPYPNREVPDCLAKNASNPRKCALGRHDDQVRLDWVQRANEVTGARRGGASVIDPTGWFCTDQSCPAVVGNTLVYLDESHITATYARQLAPVLSPYLVAAMGGRSGGPVRRAVSPHGTPAGAGRPPRLG